VRGVTGSQATVDVVRQGGRDARALHLACHGWVVPKDPLASGVALSPGGGEDGLLLASDIMQSVRLHADLVMLSACETGLGQATQFEGLLGLTRAWEYAGARSVGVTLWKVEVSATSAMMAGFYRAWKGGAPKDEALRQAQIAVMRRPQWRHPYYWAALQLVGGPGLANRLRRNAAGAALIAPEHRPAGSRRRHVEVSCAPAARAATSAAAIRNWACDTLPRSTPSGVRARAFASPKGSSPLGQLPG
jgi:hypothetical protein